MIIHLGFMVLHCTLETTHSVRLKILPWYTLYRHMQEEQKSTLVSFKEAVEVQCRTLRRITWKTELTFG